MGYSFSLTQTAIEDTFVVDGLKNGSHGLKERKKSPINHGPQHRVKVLLGVESD